MKEYFLIFECPHYVDATEVLKKIQKELSESKCKMKKCGTDMGLLKLMTKKVTNACSGTAIPPKYTKTKC